MYTNAQRHTHSRVFDQPESLCKWGQRRCRPESATGQSRRPCRPSCCWPGYFGRRGLGEHSSCLTDTSCLQRCRAASRPAVSLWSARRSATSKEKKPHMHTVRDRGGEAGRVQQRRRLMNREWKMRKRKDVLKQMIGASTGDKRRTRGRRSVTEAT